ncbi:MAG TPA: cytochrome P450 [Streptosporangiaceae bacterium]|nr:cytochrome P450 [Streptosporangiaceae bacterium]
MPVSHAHVPTTRARRYLAQLGSHSRQLGRLARHQAHRPGEGGAPPAARTAAWSDASGIIDFGWGRCTLDATDEALTLRAEADDPDHLQLIQDGIARRVERIGRRDQLTVTWQPVSPELTPATPAGELRPTTAAPPGEQRPTTAVPANKSQTAAAVPAHEHQAASAIVGALTSPAGRAEPFPLYAAAHELGPVLEISEGWFLVCSYEGVNQVLRDPGFGLPDPASPRPGDGELSSLSRSILRANPPDHPRMRSLIAQVFTPRRIAALRPAIETAVDALLDRLAEAGADGEAVDFMDHFAFQLPVTVICELLGVPQADRDRFRPLAADLTEALELPTGQPGDGPASVEPAGDYRASHGPAGDYPASHDPASHDPASHDPASHGPAGPGSGGKGFARKGPAGMGPAAAARELAGYFTALIAQRRAHPVDDLLGALVAARDADDGRLSEEELLANLILLLVAGFETTTSLLGNGLALLFDHPETVSALRSGSLEVSGFIEEVLRYDSPVQLITRQARAGDRTVAGRPVPAGSQVILLIGAANRDRVRYADPDRFDPARFDPARFDPARFDPARFDPARFDPDRSGAARFDPDRSGPGRGAPRPLSFGAGPHICIGNSLARLEAAVAFPRLLVRFPTIRAASGPPPTRRDRLVLRGYETLPVAVADGSA